jgi:hypothetical protein
LVEEAAEEAEILGDPTAGDSPVEEERVQTPPFATVAAPPVPLASGEVDFAALLNRPVRQDRKKKKRKSSLKRLVSLNLHIFTAVALLLLTFTLEGFLDLSAVRLLSIYGQYITSA